MQNRLNIKFGIADAPSPTPSALFARRLMHYCSAEVESASSLRASSPIPVAASPPSRPQFSFQHHLKPRHGHVPILSPETSSWLWNEAEAERRRQEMEEDLEDSLEELSEGIDILQILEQAYDRTIKAHVAPATPPLTRQNSLDDSPSAQPSTANASSPPGLSASPEHVPLMSGSSTALLAVLDHAPRQNAASATLAKPPVAHQGLSADGSTTPTAGLPINYAAGTLHPSITLNHEEANCDAVIRVAHIGDCMGMLVRGEQIVWRSEEMWWDVSHRFLVSLPSESCSSFHLSV